MNQWTSDSIRLKTARAKIEERKIDFEDLNELLEAIEASLLSPTNITIERRIRTDHKQSH